MGCYGKDHNNDECDKCLADIGEKNLLKLPFLYCDKNDDMHKDVSFMLGYPNAGYRQYYACKRCFDIETRRLK